MSDKHQQLEEELNAQREARRLAGAESDQRGYFAAVGCGISSGMLAGYLATAIYASVRNGWLDEAMWVAAAAVAFVAGLVFKRVMFYKAGPG